MSRPRISRQVTARSRTFDSKEYENATKRVQRLSIELTGARPGEYLLGVQKAVNGALLKNVGATIPPFKNSLERIKNFPDLWQKFLVKLNAIDFFSEMDDLEKEEWLFENANEKDTYIHETDGTEVQVLGIGTKQSTKSKDNKFYEKLTQEQIDELLADPDEVWTTQEIMDIFPRKPGSKAKRHVLIFNRNFWKIYLAYEEVEEFPGLVLDVIQGRLLENVRTSENEKLIVLQDIQEQSVGFLVEKSVSYHERDLFNLVLSYYSDFDIKDIEEIREQLKYFTPAGYKSLLQKIIRFRADTLDFGNGVIYDSGFSLLVTLALLILSPGSFVPDIQRYVSGLESAAKRLAVTIFEDSYLDEENYPVIISLLSSALLRQRVKSWKPSLETIASWFKIALKARETPNYFEYDLHRGPEHRPIILNSGLSPLFLASALLDEIKSFKWDLIMFRQIAHNRGAGFAPEIDNRPEVMPLEHAIDHHWLPGIIYYYPSEVIKPMLVSGSKPFGKIYQQLFHKVTGINSRKKFFIVDDFVKETRRAQSLVLLALRTEKAPFSQNVEGSSEFNFNLSSSWIAGLLGPIEISGNPTALVTLDPNNLERLIAIRKPSRGLKDSTLSEERQREAIRRAKELLRKGISLNKAKAPTDLLKDAKIMLNDDDSYTILTDSGEYILDELENLTTTLNMISTPFGENLFSLSGLTTRTSSRTSNLAPTLFDNYLKKSIQFRGEGISIRAEEDLEELINMTNVSYVKRALIYISNFRQTIEMNPLSRDGGGTQQSVSLEDVGAFHFLNQLSLIYPVALRKAEHSLLKFEVPFGPLLWDIREKISRKILGNISYESHLWGQIYDSSERVPEDYQSSSLEEMIERHLNHKRGQFLWLKQGLGKTFIVMNYLKYLKERNELPPYIIYILPDSAIESIIQEVTYFNFQVELLWPVKKEIPESLVGVAKRGCKPNPYTITLIEHDKFKSETCMQNLLPIISQSIFIVDEVHKTLNDTIRTTMALELAHLAQDFIAFTGTPVIDDKIYKLINWLEQIVDFEVNTQNFFVAVNSMIAKKVDTGIEVVREEIEADFTIEEEKKYRSLVSPGLGGTNMAGTNMAGTNVQEAMKLSYSAATRQMIREIIAVVNEGEGIMVVARNNQHQEELYEKLMNKGFERDEIFLIKSGQSIFLTDELVESEKVPDYKVVITTMRHVLGYTLTRFNKMITSVYPSNNADREQLEGRINRLGQRSPVVTYMTVHVGILTNILRNHESVRSLSEILRDLAI